MSSPNPTVRDEVPSNSHDGGPPEASSAGQMVTAFYTQEELEKSFEKWATARIRRKLRGPILAAYRTEAEWPWYGIISLILTEFLYTLVEIGSVGVLCYPQARVHELVVEPQRDPETNANTAESADSPLSPLSDLPSDISISSSDQAPAVNPPAQKKKPSPRYQAPDFAHMASFFEEDGSQNPVTRLLNLIEIKRRIIGSYGAGTADVKSTEDLLEDIDQLEKQAIQTLLREPNMDSCITIFMRGLDFSALEWSREALRKLQAALKHKNRPSQVPPADERHKTTMSTLPPAAGPSTAPAISVSVTSEPQRHSVISPNERVSADALQNLQFRGVWSWKLSDNERLVKVAQEQITRYRNYLESKVQPGILDKDFYPLLSEYDKLTAQDLVDMHPSLIYHAQRAVVGDVDNLCASATFVNTLRLAHRSLAPHAQYTASEFFPLPESLDACQPTVDSTVGAMLCMQGLYYHSLERLWEQRFEDRRQVLSEANTSQDLSEKLRYSPNDPQDGDDDEDEDYEEMADNEDIANSYPHQDFTPSTAPTQSTPSRRTAFSRIPVGAKRAHFAQTAAPPAVLRAGLRGRTVEGKADIPQRRTGLTPLPGSAFNRSLASTSAGVTRTSSTASMTASIARLTVSTEIEPSKAGPSRLPRMARVNTQVTTSQQVHDDARIELSSRSKAGRPKAPSALLKGKGKQKADDNSVEDGNNVQSSIRGTKGKKRAVDEDASSAGPSNVAKKAKLGNGAG